MDFFKMDITTLPKNASSLKFSKTTPTSCHCACPTGSTWGYIWFIINAATRAVIGYQVSDSRDVGPCIMAMRMAFQHLKELPKSFKFIADGYSAYPLVAQQFLLKYNEKFKFKITKVIGLANDDES